jgi:hypothetical protein
VNPIVITAHLQGPITGAPMLDALLEFVVAQRAGLVAGFGPMQRVETPLAREPQDRFALCSSPVVSWEAREGRFVHRRFPIPEAQMLAEDKLRRIHIGAGPCRSYRIPGDVAWAEDDEIRWWAIGDEGLVRELLGDIRYLGKRRAVGRGIVDRWVVEACEPWGDGFPVVNAGSPMRPLPLDWQGLVDPPTAYHTLAPPYWDHAAEVLCAVPG